MIVLAWTFYELVFIGVEVGKPHSAHLYYWSLPVGGFTLLSGLFLFGYLAHIMKENKQELPVRRSFSGKLKDKTVTFWASIVAIIWVTVSMWLDVGNECKGYIVGWDLPCWSLIINLWMFGFGYIARKGEHQNILLNLKY